MPPRFAYWTILIDNAPTAFRAKDQADLLPTVQQLRRTNANVVLKWFAHGRVWDSPEQARESRRPQPKGPRNPKPEDRRGRDWRPGGEHRDPRARTKPAEARGDARPGGGAGRAAGTGGQGRWQERRPAGPGKPQGGYRDRPWQGKPKPTGREDRDRGPRDTRPREREQRANTDRPERRGPSGPPRRPYEHRPPAGQDARHRAPWPKRSPQGRSDWTPKPHSAAKPRGEPPRDWKRKPDRPKGSAWTPKRRPPLEAAPDERRRREGQSGAQTPHKPAKPPNGADHD